MESNISFKVKVICQCGCYELYVFSSDSQMYKCIEFVFSLEQAWFLFIFSSWLPREDVSKE